MFELTVNDEWVLKKLGYWANISRPERIAPGFAVSWESLFSDGRIQAFIRSLNVDPKSFGRLYEKAAELEKFIYMTNSRYRDHLSHSVRVAVLGHYLLKEAPVLTSTGLNLGEYFCQHKSFGMKDLLKSWWIASLFHDICYPIANLYTSIKALIEQINDAFSPLAVIPRPPLFDFNVEAKESNDAVDILTQIMKSSLNTDAYREFETARDVTLSSEELDHGISGALFLLMLTHGKHDEALCEAAKAIALHTLKAIEVVLEEEPVAGLLILCDEIQEWGREIREANGYFYSFKTRVLIDKMKLIVEDGSLFFQSTFENELDMKRTDFRTDQFEKGKTLKLGRIKRKAGGKPSFSISYNVKGKSYQFSLSI